MQEYFKSKVIFTVSGGSRQREIIQSYCRDFRHTGTTAHFYRSGFRPALHASVVSKRFEWQSWGKTQRQLEDLTADFFQFKLRVDRTRLLVSLDDMKDLASQPLYFMGSRLITIHPEHAPRLLDICRGNALFPIQDEESSLNKKYQEAWLVCGRYDVPAGAGTDAKSEFFAAVTSLEGILKGPAAPPEFDCVIQDNDDGEEDLKWVAPPLPGGEVDQLYPF